MVLSIPSSQEQGDSKGDTEGDSGNGGAGVIRKNRKYEGQKEVMKT